MKVTALFTILTAASMIETAFASKGGKKNDPRMMHNQKRAKKDSSDDEDGELKVPKGCTTFKIVRFDAEKRFVETPV